MLTVATVRPSNVKFSTGRSEGSWLICSMYLLYSFHAQTCRFSFVNAGSVEGRRPGPVDGGHLGRGDLAEGPRVGHEADLHAGFGGPDHVSLALGFGERTGRARVVAAGLPVPGVDAVHGSIVPFSRANLQVFSRRPEHPRSEPARCRWSPGRGACGWGCPGTL